MGTLGDNRVNPAHHFFVQNPSCPDTRVIQDLCGKQAPVYNRVYRVIHRKAVALTITTIRIYQLQDKNRKPVIGHRSAPVHRTTART
jgi:hypothetical protein